ncbi:MAG: DNA-binding response regulator [Anaerolineae bacterium]|nr:MAG: DNA-binding response regulator [Anaerolineae bacterium]
MSARILVVDDDPRYVRLVEANLETAGYQVEVAYSGEEAIRKVQNNPPDLILLDVMMRGLDGMETCERIRRFSNVPIIMVTARGGEQDRVQGLDSGADDYIVKPYSVNELLARVRANLRRARLSPAESHPAEFELGDLRVDLGRAIVFLKGEEVPLSTIEYRLLLQFILHQGETLSHEMLLENVWGEQYREEKEILWVTISRLRQKLEENPRIPRYIVTRQGLGYTMPEADEFRKRGNA